MSALSSFDPVKYKETTQKQWDAAADAWDRWGPFLDEWLGPATNLMLDLAEVRAMAKVLDVAAGAGGQTIVAAKRVGPTGKVTATDISAKILEKAAENAKKARLLNVEIKQVDGEEMEFKENSYHAAISRVGLIYFPDQQKALKAILHALRPGGRFSTITYSTPENNKFFSIPVSIIRQKANLPAPAPGQPGPFSLGADGALEEALTRAGFKDVKVRKISAPLMMPSAAECVRFEKESFGALHTMLSGLDDAAKEEAWKEIEESLKQFEKDGAFEGPCELIVGCGTK
jgi:ubiquinone/menaquinone biosynthesis C-methylase UbiE